jgi:predicted MFS family arabinose efflux permease
MIRLCLQGTAKNFTTLLIGVLLNAMGNSVLGNMPYAIITDLLPPEQARCSPP